MGLCYERGVSQGAITHTPDDIETHSHPFRTFCGPSETLDAKANTAIAWCPRCFAIDKLVRALLPSQPGISVSLCIAAPRASGSSRRTYRHVRHPLRSRVSLPMDSLSESSWSGRLYGGCRCVERREVRAVGEAKASGGVYSESSLLDMKGERKLKGGGRGRWGGKMWSLTSGSPIKVFQVATHTST